MTTVNVAILHDRIVVASDGLAYGKRQQFMPKTWPLPHLSAVIAARGPMEISTQIPRLACEFHNLTSMKAGLSELLKKKYGIASKIFRKFFVFDVVVAGYSEGRPVLFSVSSRDWETEVAEDGYICPAVDLHGIQTVNKPIETTMAKLMTRQREQYGDIGCGGFGQLTTIFPSGEIVTKMFCKF